MKSSTRLAVIVLALISIPWALRAQQQAAPPSDDSMTHLRVDILLTEYNGGKKISSLPYTIYIGSLRGRPRASRGTLRMGVKVPVDTGGNITYMDVGTNIDCDESFLGNGVYDLNVTVNQSSIYSASESDSESEQIHAAGGRPIIRNFFTDFDIKLHGRRNIRDRSSQWSHTEDQRDAARHKIDSGKRE